MSRSHEDLRKGEIPPSDLLDVEIFDEFGQRTNLSNERRLPPEAMRGVIDYYQQVQVEIDRRVEETNKMVVEAFRSGTPREFLSPQDAANKALKEHGIRRRFSNLESSSIEAGNRVRELEAVEKIMILRREIAEREKELSALEAHLGTTS